MLSVCRGYASDYPEAQPGDRLYRARGDEKLYRVTIPGLPIWSGNRVGGSYAEADRVTLAAMTFEEMKEALRKEGIRIEIDARRKVAEDGRKKLMFWLPFIFLSIAATFFLKSYGLQIIGVVGFAVASSFFISGIIEVKLAENWAVGTWVVTGLGIVGVIAFAASAFILKDKGLGKPGIVGAWFDKLKSKFTKD